MAHQMAALAGVGTAAAALLPGRGWCLPEGGEGPAWGWVEALAGTAERMGGEGRAHMVGWAVRCCGKQHGSPAAAGVTCR